MALVGMGRKRYPLGWAAVKQSTQLKGSEVDIVTETIPGPEFCLFILSFFSHKKLLSCKEMKWYSRIIQDPFIEKKK